MIRGIWVATVIDNGTWPQPNFVRFSENHDCQHHCFQNIMQFLKENKQKSNEMIPSDLLLLRIRDRIRAEIRLQSFKVTTQIIRSH